MKDNFKRKIFTSEQNQINFDLDGYFTVELIDAEDIDFLKALFNMAYPKDSKNFYATIDINDEEYRRKVHQLISERILNKIKSLFYDYDAIVFNFIVKLPGNDTTVFVHNDHTHVDETIFQSVNLWIPLVDINYQNGMFYVLPGSHHFPNPPRGFFLPYPYSNFHDIIKPFMKPVPVNAGNAVVYNNKLLHCSDPNLSNEVRPAVIAGMLPIEATPIIYFKHDKVPQNMVEIFHLDTEFYLKFNREFKPEFAKSYAIVQYNDISLKESGLLIELKRLKEVSVDK